MAKITDIRLCNRRIRVVNRSVMEVNSNEQYFSIWVHAAGQETGNDLHPTSIQMDKEKARQLLAHLKSFVEG